MAVGLYDLIYGVPDEICNDHEIGSVVQEHRDEGMPEVVVSDAFDPRFFDICVKGVGEGVFVDRVLAAEEERGFARVPCKLVAQGGANGGISDLLVLGGCDLVRGTVHGLAGVGLIE